MQNLTHEYHKLAQVSYHEDNPWAEDNYLFYPEVEKVFTKFPIGAIIFKGFRKSGIIEVWFKKDQTCWTDGIIDRAWDKVTGPYYLDKETFEFYEGPSRLEMQYLKALQRAINHPLISPAVSECTRDLLAKMIEDPTYCELEYTQEYQDHHLAIQGTKFNEFGTVYFQFDWNHVSKPLDLIANHRRAGRPVKTRKNQAGYYLPCQTHFEDEILAECKTLKWVCEKLGVQF